MARGKTKGATSFCKVNLRELNRVLKEDASVVISKRYAETLDLTIEGNFKATTKNIVAEKPVGVVVEELESVPEVKIEKW